MSSPLSRTWPRPAPQEDAASATLKMKIERQLGSTRQLAQTQAAILFAKRRALKALEKLDGQMYGRRWFEERTAAIEAAAQRALDDAEAAAAGRLAAARETASEAARREPPANSAEAQLLELQVGNAWTSLRQILERASKQADGLAAIEAAAASASTDAIKIEALRRFGDDWIAGTFSQEPRYARERISDAFHAGIDQAELPTLSPVQRTAREILADLDTGQARLQASSREVRRELEGRGAIAAAIGSWEGEAIMLSHKGQPIGPESDTAIRATFGADALAWEASAHRNHPLLSEAGALAGTNLDPSPSAQLWRRIDAATGSTRAPGQE